MRLPTKRLRNVTVRLAFLVAHDRRYAVIAAILLSARIAGVLIGGG